MQEYFRLFLAEKQSIRHGYLSVSHQVLREMGPSTEALEYRISITRRKAAGCRVSVASRADGGAAGGKIEFVNERRSLGEIAVADP